MPLNCSNAGQLPPDAPWPVAAKNLLSKREHELYQILQDLYPDHRLFVQVALSQLIDVPRDHPERYSIRARFSQLVADFVLCRPDLSIVAVVELDDRTHLHPARQAADARKTKALKDAGLPLVRVPAGRLPSANRLRELVDKTGVSPASSNSVSHQLTNSVSDFRLAFEPVASAGQAPKTYNEKGISRLIHRELVRVGLGAVVLLFGWLIYAFVLPRAIQHAFQDLAPKPVAASIIQPPRPVNPPRVAFRATSPIPSTPPATQERLLAEQRAQALAAADLVREKQRAWTTYYQALASCEHPIDWNAQVQCGNQYMRAKRSFEAIWAERHSTKNAAESGLVLDNASINEVGRSGPLSGVRN